MCNVWCSLIIYPSSTCTFLFLYSCKSGEKEWEREMVISSPPFLNGFHLYCIFSQQMHWTPWKNYSSNPWSSVILKHVCKHAPLIHCMEQGNYSHIIAFQLKTCLCSQLNIFTTGLLQVPELQWTSSQGFIYTFSGCYFLINHYLCSIWGQIKHPYQLKWGCMWNWT